MKTVKKPLVVLGKHYTGKRKQFMNSTTGVYWEALPAIEGHALSIQDCLTAKKDDRPGLFARLGSALAALRCRPGTLNPRTGVMQ